MGVQLRKRIAKCEFEKQPLSSVMAFIHREGQIDIVVDSSSVSPEQPITVKLANASIAEILDRVVQGTDIRWTLIANYVYVSDARGIKAMQGVTRQAERPVTPSSWQVTTKPLSAAMEAQLNTRIDVTLAGQSLESTLASLMVAGGIEIVMGESVSTTEPVDLTANRTPLRTVLDQFARTQRLKWTVVDELVFVSDDDGIKRFVDLETGASELVASRDAGLLESGDAWRRQARIVRAKLFKRLSPVDFQDQPLEAVAEAVGDAAGVRVMIDPRVGAKQGVTLQLVSARARTVLNLITSKQDLRWVIMGDHVVILPRSGTERADESKP
jgi:hypothetical protein